MKQLTAGIVFVVLVVLSSGCSQKGEEGKTVEGVIKTVVGIATLERNGQQSPLMVNQKVKPGDIIITSEKSIVILSMGDISDFEIQPGSRFTIEDFNKSSKVINLSSGNSWIRINKKLSKGESFEVRTTTTVASVRGTKFYSFKLADMQGLCICEGKVSHNMKGCAKPDQVHNQDVLIMTRNGKSIMLTPKDLPFMNMVSGDHRHSMLENSPLGGKDQMTPMMAKKFIKVANQKFSELN